MSSRTDIQGANNLIDSIFITNGVHRDEFTSDNELNLLEKYKVNKLFSKIIDLVMRIYNNLKISRIIKIQ